MVVGGDGGGGSGGGEVCEFIDKASGTPANQLAHPSTAMAFSWN